MANFIFNHINLNQDECILLLFVLIIFLTIHVDHHLFEHHMRLIDLEKKFKDDK